MKEKKKKIIFSKKNSCKVDRYNKKLYFCQPKTKRKIMSYTLFILIRSNGQITRTTTNKGVIMAKSENTVFARRLVNARKMRGLTQRGLCALVNVSPNAIAKYESGAMLPTSAMEAALAQALGVSVDYFHRPFTFSIPATGWEFRKRASLGETKINAIKQKALHMMENIADIEEVFGIQRSFQINYNDVVVSTIEEAEEQARRLRNDLGLGIAPFVKPIERLESLGVRIVEMEADAKFLGTSTKVGNIPLVVLNATFTPEGKRFTLFHEMAHLLLKLADKADAEHVCNAFASEMLIPSSVLINRLGMNRKSITLKELEDLQTEYGISKEALMYKACQHNIITENYFKYFNIKLNTRKNVVFRERVQKSLWPVETSQYLYNLVMQALTNELITKTKAASLLDVDVETINNITVI